MEKTFYDYLLDIDVDQEDVVSGFTKNTEEVQRATEVILEAAYQEHKKECSKGRTCPGVGANVPKNLKAVLVSHPEYTPDIVLGIISLVMLQVGEFFGLAKAKEELHTDEPDEVLEKLKKLFGEKNVKMTKIDLFKDEKN